MAVQTVTHLFGKEIRRSPFIAGSRPLRVKTEVGDCELTANLGQMIIMPKTPNSVIATAKLGIPPQPYSKIIAAAEINQSQLQADILLGVVTISLIHTPD